MGLKIGDVVSRKSYKKDLFFKVKELKNVGDEKFAILKGMSVRLIADAPVEDLEKKEPQEILFFRHKLISQYVNKILKIRKNKGNGGKNIIPGEVLHIDSDQEYLEKSLSLYKSLQVPAEGVLLEEKKLPQKIAFLLEEYSPDILVLTGLDSLSKKGKNLFDINSYKNSKFFCEAIKEARKVEPNKNKLVIFAGASQSHSEALLGAGANIASSPNRTFLNVYDPVFIVEKISYTPIDKVLDISNLVENTFSSPDGISGIKTKGCSIPEISTKKFIDIY